MQNGAKRWFDHNRRKAAEARSAAYTSQMDRVRLGRVLGRGARIAARTVYEAVDAATSSAPTISGTPPSSKSESVPASNRTSAYRPSSTTASTSNAGTAVQQALRTATQMQTSARSAKRGVLAPVKRATRALTLEMTGSFFALFALSFCIALWRSRELLYSNPTAPRLWLYLALAALFFYFSATNFVRAHRISKGLG